MKKDYIIGFIVKLILVIAAYSIAELISDTFVSGWIASALVSLIFHIGELKCK